MEVEHALSGLCASVGTKPETMFIETEARGYFIDFSKVMDNILLRSVFYEVGIVNIFAFWDDEYVGWSDGEGVMEGEYVIVFVYFFSGNLPADDLSEDVVGIVHG